MIRSITGRIVVANATALMLCFAVLLTSVIYFVQSESSLAFQKNAQSLTRFVAKTVGPGARLKREAMVTPALEPVFAAEGLEALAVRVVNVDGTEVARLANPAAGGEAAPAFAEPDFEAPARAHWADGALISASPIVLGAGDAARLVGEVQIIWSGAQVANKLWSLAALLAGLFGATLLVATGAMVLGGRQFVARPLADCADYMKRLADGELDTPEPRGSASEIARMRGALAVFRDGLAARQRDEAAAEAGRDAERAELAHAKRFQESLDAAIDAAAKGVLDVRVSAQDADPGRSAVATAFNRLLERVEIVIADAKATLAALAHGRLSARMEGGCEGAFAELRSGANSAADQLSTLVSRVDASAVALGAGVRRIDADAGDLAQRASTQAAALEETAATMEQMSASIRSNAASAGRAQALARNASEQAGDGRRVVGRAVEAMAEIHKSSGQIAEIISAIDAIAFKTNLLALNAAVEAARAGDAGKGFAVVASEVRALAQQAATSATSVRELIETSATHVDAGVGLVRNAGGVIDGIVAAIAAVDEKIAEIASATGQQAEGVEEISATIANLDEMTQENASLAAQTRENARRIKDGAAAMDAALGVFDVQRETGAAAAA